MSLVCFYLIFYPRLTGAISLPAERVRCANADSRLFLPINRGVLSLVLFFFSSSSITLHAMASSSDANASLSTLRVIMILNKTQFTLELKRL